MAALLRPYGVATTIEFVIRKRSVVDFAVSADWTPASGDTKISKDQGAEANTGSNPAIVASNTAKWSLALTATEMSAGQISVVIIDSATKAVEDQCILIETYGAPGSGAYHTALPANMIQVDGHTLTNHEQGSVPADLFASTTGTGNSPQQEIARECYEYWDAQTDGGVAMLAIKTKTDFLPSILAGSAGGVFIAGSNAATTVATLTITGTLSVNGAVVVVSSEGYISANMVQVDGHTLASHEQGFVPADLFGTTTGTGNTVQTELAREFYEYVLAQGGSFSGGSGGLDASGVRAAIGLASANLDTQLLPLASTLNANMIQVDGHTLAPHEQGFVPADLFGATTGTGNTVQAEIGREVVAAITAAGGVAATIADKTGFKLASDGLDQIPMTQPGAERPTTFRECLMWLFRRFGNKTKYDKSGLNLIVYADDGTTTLSSQPYTSNSSSQTVDPLT